jgi:transposase
LEACQVIDVMTRLKIHNMAMGGTAQADIAEKCDISQRSVERILTEPPPTRDEIVAEVRDRALRPGRPPKADDTMVDRIRLLLKSEPRLPATEVLRRAREWGYTGGRSQTAELVKRLRPAPKKEPIVRFEGLPGEYVQFDFGEVEIDFVATGKQRIHFFGGRLKCSRFMHVVLVPDQCAETLVRSVVACLVAFGGSPKEWVFDNPKTVRISAFGTTPIVLHRYLAQLVAEYRVIPTLCAPRSGNQKGSVERLVGFVKNSFFRVRRFKDMADLEAQLTDWLHEVNFVRPSDATGVVPAKAIDDERRWLDERPIQVAPSQWTIEESATVTPMGTVSIFGTSYSATATRLGAPATVLVRQNEIEIRIGDEHCAHTREDHTGEVRRLPEHREAVLAVLHGNRKLATFRRQCLLELGQPAWQFLGALVHLCPHGRWEGPCTELYEMLVDYGDEPLRKAFAQCVHDEDFTVKAVRAALGEAA